MIPKVIHYIWLGGGEMPQIAKKCIESWKKYCPDYEIKRWDETNLDIDICPYARQAYDCKKYAFVSDVFRFYILEKEGGIYLDIDVKLIKPLDEFLNDECFLGFEDKYSLNTGLIVGACAHNKDINAILQTLLNDQFVDEKGKQNLETACVRTTKHYLAHGLVLNNQKQNVSDSTIYPKEYFNPLDLNTNKMHITSDTHSIHHFAATWFGPKQKFKTFVKKFLNVITFGLFGKLRSKIGGKTRAKNSGILEESQKN